MGLFDRFRSMFGRVDPGTGLQFRYLKHYNTSLNFWAENNIFIENIYTKIANDISLMDFRHVKITRVEGGPDKMEWLEHSDLSRVLNQRPNEYETPTLFWVRVIRKMLRDDVAVVVPVYEGPRLKSLELADELSSYDEKNVTIRVGDVEHVYPLANCWVFENPREGLSEALNKMLNLISSNLDRLMEKLGTTSELQGFLEIDTKIQDEEMLDYVKKRIANIYEAAKNGKIGYLQQGEGFKELNHTFNTASMEEMQLLKDAINQGYGLNESLFNCTYSEMTYRAYQQSILNPFLRNIKQEVNSKAFTQTAITQGHRIITYMDPYQIASLKDLTEFAFRAKYSALMSSNEIREIFGLAAYDGGDIYESNLNAVTVGGGTSGALEEDQDI